MAGDLRIEIDADKLLIRDLETLESGRGLYDLIKRVVVSCAVGGKAIDVGELPMPRLREVGEAIAEAVKGLADPNA